MKDLSVSKKTLSLCMIAKDEASFLEQCLAVAASHVDEIIVVDTGSSDDTTRVAEAAGANVSTFAWVDDFAAPEMPRWRPHRGIGFFCSIATS